MSEAWYGMNWIRPERRSAIYARDNDACVYCNRNLSDCSQGERGLDHLTPRSAGGGNASANLVTVCRTCNSRRQDRDWRTFALATGGQEAVSRVARAIRLSTRFGQTRRMKLSACLLVSVRSIGA